MHGAEGRGAGTGCASRGWWGGANPLGQGAEAVAPRSGSPLPGVRKGARLPAGAAAKEGASWEVWRGLRPF